MEENTNKYKIRTKESKSASFKRLAEKRTTSDLKSLDLIANLSNKYYYEYEDEDVDKILTALRLRLKDVDKQFLDQRKNKQKEDFKL